MHQTPGNLQPPLHATGVVFHLDVSLLDQIHQFQNLINPLLTQLAVHSVHPAVKVQVLPTGKHSIYGRILKDDADRGSHSVPFSSHVVTPYPGFTLCWREHGGKHLDDGALASSIGTQETEELAPIYFQVYVIHGGHFAEPFSQTQHVDGCLALGLARLMHVHRFNSICDIFHLLNLMSIDLHIVSNKCVSSSLPGNLNLQYESVIANSKHSAQEVLHGRTHILKKL